MLCARFLRWVLFLLPPSLLLSILPLLSVEVGQNEIAEISKKFPSGRGFTKAPI